MIDINKLKWVGLILVALLFIGSIINAITLSELFLGYILISIWGIMDMLKEKLEKED